MKSAKAVLQHLFLCVIVLLASGGPAYAAPVPDIKLNGLDGPVVLGQSDTLTVSVALDNGGVTANSDWWFAIETESGVLVMNSAGSFGTAVVPAYQGPLASFPPATILTIPLTSVPGGTYTFYFGVDTNGNGSLDADSLYVDSATLIVATPTAKGTPTGAATTQTIGAAGGTISGGSITVNIPPGALSSDRSISITPISNTAYNGVGSSFELGPSGQTFAVPVQVTMRLTDQDLAGSSLNTMRIAFQGSDGYWNSAENVTYDEASGSVTATTSHFSSATAYQHLTLIPRQATVKVGKDVNFKVGECADLLQEIKNPPTYLTRKLYECRNPHPLFAQARRQAAGAERTASTLFRFGYDADPWQVDGIVGGNSRVGTVAKIGTVNGRYTAPSTVPQPDQVSVFTVVRDTLIGYVYNVVSDVKIVDDEGYAGIINIKSYDPAFTARLDVLFTLDPSVQGGKYYRMSGDLTLTSAIVVDKNNTCSPLPGQEKGKLIIGTGTTELQIYNSPANTYNLQFATGAQIMTRCVDNSTKPPTVTIAPFPVIISMMPPVLCGGSSPLIGVYGITDINHLQGSELFLCGMWDITWDLKRPVTP